MSKVLVVGGGIIGLSSAYYLQQAGHEVTVVEKGSLEDNCSFGNAGMIVPSHFVPLAAPGMVEQGIRWMFDSKSPFYVRPSLDMALVSWGLKFLKKANRKHVDASAEPLRDLSLFSTILYQELAKQEGFDFGLHNNGILMLYKTPKVGEEELHMAEKAKGLGLDVVALTAAESQALQPDIRLDIAGAVHYRCDGHITPNALMRQMVKHLESKGVKIMYNSTVDKIETKGGKITHVFAGEWGLKADTVVIAGGAWSPRIVELAGLNMPLMPGKGYSFMVDEPQQRMHIPALLMEARVSVTPMGDQIRFGGTMEIGPMNDKVNMRRVEGIVESIPRYFPDIKPAVPAQSKVWYGFRPCSPDGLPYIGRSGKISNLVIAGGHGMMGLSLGPATGKLVAQIVSEVQPSISVEAFAPDR